MAPLFLLLTFAAPMIVADIRAGVWTTASGGVLQVERTPGGGFSYSFDDHAIAPQLICRGAAAVLQNAPLTCRRGETELHAALDVDRATARLRLVDTGARTFLLRRADPFVAFVRRHLTELRRSNLHASDGRALIDTLGPRPERTTRRLAGRLRALYAAAAGSPGTLILDDVDELFRIAHMSLLRSCGSVEGGRCRTDDQHLLLAEAVREFLAGRAEDDQR